jgi:hypothetical protein
MIQKKTGVAGRKLTKEGFDRFDSLQRIGDSMVIPKQIPERHPIKSIRMKLLNQARSYAFSDPIHSKFKISTRITPQGISVVRIS